MNSITVIQTTPQELQNLISEGIKNQLEDLKKHFQPKEPNSYLSRQEVAEMFKVDISTIHNWSKNGKLKPIGFGGRVYFLRSDIEKSLTPLNV